MKMLIWFSVLVLICSVEAGVFTKRNVMISDRIHADNCSDAPKDDPVKIRDAEVFTSKEGDIVIAGRVMTSQLLNSSIKAAVSMQRKVLGLWVHMPCIGGFGSCNYDDLCQYGVPSNEDCSPVFEENDVPCRCAIPVGNYTLPGGQFKVPGTRWAAVLSGNYRATVELTQDNIHLACYNATFKLE